MQNFITFALILFVNSIIQIHGYEIPHPTLEILSPKGFRISIPSDPNIIVFAFHGAINRVLRGIETGDFNGESRQPVNNNYVYENLKEYLAPGDTLYYWIHVQHGNHVYRLMEQSIVVPRLSTGNQNFEQTTTAAKPTFFFTFGDTSLFNSNFTSQQIPVFNPQSIFSSSTTAGTIFDPTTRVSIFSPPKTESTQLRPIGDPQLQMNPPQRPITNQNCVQSKTKVRGKRVCSGSLIFEDNFNLLNWTKWQREIKMPLDSEDAEFVSYQDRPENCYITDGNLNIMPTLLTNITGYNHESIRFGELDLGSKCTGIVDVEVECRRKGGIFRILPPIVSAKIRTKNSFSFIYGRVEIRAKLPKGDWIFPQIYLEPLNNNYGKTGFASGQMRVAHIHGNEYLETRDGLNIGGNQLYGGVVLTTGERFRNIWLKKHSLPNHLNSDFHVYTLTWTETTISLAVDGNEYSILRGGFKTHYYTNNITNTQSWQNGGYLAPFDKEFYLSLGVSIGGISDFPDRSVTGLDRKQKPWFNFDPKAELRFWNDLDNWHPTWDGTDSGLIVDYIKVWAL